jgi:Skp family chaperone for outer membrane proteins
MLSTRDIDDGAPMARIAQLVAAIKAKREAAGVATPAGSDERDRAVALLRHFIAAREEEQREWQAALQALEAELDESRAAAHAAQARQEQASAAEQRARADLELLHEHQRSIWQLERRRFEITIAGLDSARRTRRSRLNLTVALVIAGVVGLTLVGSRQSRAPASDVHDAGAYSPASGSSR